MAKLRFNGNISEAAGSVGRLTYRRSVVGQQITERTNPTNVRTSAQLDVRADFTGASDGWTALDPAKKALWKTFAKSRTRRDPVTGQNYSLTGRATYIGLASKFLQIGSGSEIPTDPPVVRFAGDTITFSASILDGEATVVFTASGANASAASTEFLAQRLTSADRAPTADGYVSKGFFKFVTGTLSKNVTLGPGIWAVATRFVCPATGEEKGIVPLDTMMLGLMLVSGGLDDEEEEVEAKRAA